jgi:hypothetical protein
MLQDESLLQYMHDCVFHWYQQADTKAQVILGFTGVFLTILVGALVSNFFEPKPSATASLQGLTLRLFWAALVLHLGAVLFSAAALWSRGMFREKKRGVVFFGHIANYGKATEFNEAVCSSVNQENYRDELARSIWALSQNTRLKHRLVDAAVISSCFALATTVWLLVTLLK